MELISKERMKIAMDHKETDRVPYQACFVRIGNRTYMHNIAIY